MILPLDEPLDAQYYGGKAARLSTCLRAGLPVPAGIALHPDLVARLAQGHQTAGERTWLAQHLARFGTAALAVRSSAIGEDGADASFAGQHATRLNVRGLDGVLSAIIAVWASGQAESARRYRARMGITGETHVAVLIQELVPAEVAGVLFTCDPLSGMRDHWIVEASWGLGEAVVAGLITPDHYTLTPTGELLARQLGSKEMAIIPDAQGGTRQHPVSDPAQGQQACLDEEARARLAALGVACEDLFGPAEAHRVGASGHEALAVTMSSHHEWRPPMMDLLELGGIAAAVVAAYQSHLLQALLNGSATPASYAEELGLDATATERLLDVLAQVGVADCEHGSYAASTGLSQLDAQQLGGLDAIGALWSQVPAFLVHGERLAFMDGPPAVREAAYSPIVSGLVKLFAEAPRQLAAALAGSPTQILDVGAGSGIWSLAMAELHPHARVTALDLPGVLAAFRRQAERMGLVDRTLTLAGDFHQVVLPPERFDRVVLPNVLHLEPPAQAAALIRRVASSLVRGGELVIVEMLGDGTPAGERARAIYALHLALRTHQGQVHPLSELQAWAEQAGLLLREVIPLSTLPGMAALVARAPAQEVSTKERREEE